MTKNILESKFYRWLDVASNFLFLNLAWLVACLPIITVYPATAAMFAVVRKWVREREFGGVFRDFLSFFKRDFKQSFAVGLIWTFFGAALAVNWFLISGTPDALRVPLYAFFVAVGFVYAMASVFLFPVMVNYDTDARGVLKNSLLLSISRTPTAILGFAILATAAALASVFPVVVLFAGSASAYAVYRLCERSFARITAASEGDEPSDRPRR